MSSVLEQEFCFPKEEFDISKNLFWYHQIKSWYTLKLNWSYHNEILVCYVSVG